MDFSHLKHSKLARHLQTYKGRLVLREDNVKDHREVLAVTSVENRTSLFLSVFFFLQL